jgi:transposase
VGQHGSASASRLLGLDSFEVFAAQVVGGEWQLTVQSTATVVGCQGCGMRAELHGRRTVRVRDLPLGGRPAVLWWRKRLWRCREPACEVRTWTEQAAAIRPRVVLTERARAEACRRVGKDAHAVAAVARDLGVGWATVMRAVAEHGRPLVDDAARLQGVTALGLDETSFSRRPRQRQPGGSPVWWTWSAAGCWMWWPTAPGPRWTAGSTLSHATGWPRSAQWRWIPGVAMPAP